MINFARRNRRGWRKSLRSLATLMRRHAGLPLPPAPTARMGAKEKAARIILRAALEPGGYPMRPGDPLVTCPSRHLGLR